MKIEEAIGRNLRLRRQELDLTQEEVGVRAGALLDASWSRQTIYVAEQGGRSFTAVELLALAVVLGTTVEQLFRVPLETDTVALPSGRLLTRDELTYSRVDEGSAGALLDEMRKVLQHLQHMVVVQSDRQVRAIHAVSELTSSPGSSDQNAALRVLYDHIEQLNRALSSGPTVADGGTT